MNDNNLLLNIKIDSEFLRLSSKLNQSFKVQGIRVLEAIFSTVVGMCMVIPCSDVLVTHWN